MPNFKPNLELIEDTMVELEDAPPLEREQAANLVASWIQKFGPLDAQLKIEAVELGFIVYVDSLTAVIGVQDAIMSDARGYFGNEWKTAKEPKKYNGRDSWWWNEDVWLTDISNGAQIQIYALALNRGVFYEKHTKRAFEFKQPNPRIRVRAAVKSDPPRFWPTVASGVYSFNDTQLGSIERALRGKAELVRAARHANLVPWQLTGKQCHQFGNACQFLEQCKAGHHPVSGLVANDKLQLQAQFDMSDPAAELALPFIPAELIANPEFVVLSASQYTLASDCFEKYRIINSHLAPKGSSDAQWEGKAFHAGVAEYYTQLRDWQQGTK